MAKWQCTGCDTKCKIEEPLQLNNITFTSLPLPKYKPDKVSANPPTIPDPLEYPFATICPSAGRTD